MKARMGTLSGQVMHEGKPLPEVIVALFEVKKGLPPISGIGKGGRIPDVVLLANQEGFFSQQLLQGEYYLGALIRNTEPKMGPPREGETLYFALEASGELKKFAIQDYKKADYGQINCSSTDNIIGNEDTFRVEGLVLKGDLINEPFAGAMVLAKTSKSQFNRPEYISANTGEDGKFSLILRPGPTYYLLARSALSGLRPSPGDEIGRYTTAEDTFESSENQRQLPGPPPGAVKDQSFRALNNEPLPITGKAGEVISGIKIYMYAMQITDPGAQRLIQKEIRKTAGVTRFIEGVPMNVIFTNDSYLLDPQSFAELNEWARFMKGDRELHVELNGHTDNVGTAEYNLELSTKRADAVAQYLVGKGVDSSRIKVTGYGMTMPVADNSSGEGRAKNRRVEIKYKR